MVDWKQQLGIDLTVIGQIENDPGIRCVTADGEGFDPQKSGFEHFGLWYVNRIRKRCDGTGPRST